MGLLQWAALGAAGYVAYRMWDRERGHDAHAAFASGEAGGENFAKVRNAGPESMRDKPPEWDRVDEAVDESFPASDPPATY
jgi:hypothetical protein